MSDKYVLTIADINVMEREGEYDVILCDPNSLKMPIIRGVNVSKTLIFNQIFKDN